MAETDFEAVIGPELASAIAKKGYTTLTPVQEAVLDPALAGRDLRISSQTGSGKTIAIGFTVREVISGDVASSPKGAARPRALVVAPTRELAKQVEVELSWLYAPLRVKVACVTGGGDFREERRALGSGPAIIVGTPGRLLDHLQRGSIDGTQLGAVVLDEADRMLDLGFRDDLEAILGFAPPEHRTHLVSATFPREVMALANRVQNDPARIEGTPMGAANTDIEHLVHLVLPHERLDAIVNLLLETPDATTLIFARTRADVGELTHLLSEAGFIVDSLSGEMEQRERNKALASFKRGDLHALVATDVAARGIDVQDVARVLHAEPPMDPDSYTHRSGRTGRAGRKGKSSVLVTPPALNRVSGLLKRAAVRWKIDPVPTAEVIESAREERLYEALTAIVPPEDPAEDNAEDARVGGPIEADDRSWALAKRIAEAGEGTRALARMIARTRASGPEARRITPVLPPGMKRKPWEQAAPGAAPPPRNEGRPFAEHRTFGEPRGLRPERTERNGFDTNGPRDANGPRDERQETRREPGPPRIPRDAATDAGEWVPFRVSWGQIHGADARRLLAMACRRGGITGSDVGAIRVARTFSTVNVSAAAAASFEKATREPDPRDPRVRIHPASEVDHGDRQPSAERSAPHARSVEVPADRASSRAAKSSPVIADMVDVVEVEAPAPSAKSVRDVAAERSSRSVRDVAASSKSVRDVAASSKSVRDVAASSKSVRDVAASSRSVRDVAVAEPSARSVRDVAAERSSKSVRDVSAEPSARSVRDVAASSKSVRDVSAERSSKTADRASSVEPAKSTRILEVERPSKPAHTLEIDRPSRTARNVEADRQSAPAPEADRPSRVKLTPEERPSKARHTPEERPSKAKHTPEERPSKAKHTPDERPSKAKHTPEERPSKAKPTPEERPSPADRGSRSAYGDRRPRPSQPERYSRRPAAPAPSGPPPRSDDRPRPSGDGPRPAYDRPRPSGDGPRPPYDRPRPSGDGSRPPYDRARPSNDGPRPPYEGSRPNDRARPPSNDGPRPSNDRPRPPYEGSRPSNDRPRPPYEGSRPNDRARPPSNDGPRPSNDRPRPPYEGSRPNDRARPPSNDGPRPSNDRPRPPYEGSRPSNDRPRPSSDGPRPSNDRPRPPPGGPRPPHAGPRPGGPPPSRHGDARPKHKKH